MWFKSYLFVHKTHLDRMINMGERNKLLFNSVASDLEKVSMDHPDSPHRDADRDWDAGRYQNMM